MKEKTRRTTKQDLKTLVAMLTMMKNIEDDEQDRPIDSLDKGQSADSKGIRAKDFKRSCRRNDKNDTGDLQLDYQAKLHDSQFMKKKVMITVIYKKGDPTKPGNCRPICSLPQL